LGGCDKEIKGHIARGCKNGACSEGKHGKDGREEQTFATLTLPFTPIPNFREVAP